MRAHPGIAGSNRKIKTAVAAAVFDSTGRSGQSAASRPSPTHVDAIPRRTADGSRGVEQAASGKGVLLANIGGAMMRGMRIASESRLGQRKPTPTSPLPYSTSQGVTDMRLRHTLLHDVGKGSALQLEHGPTGAEQPTRRSGVLLAIWWLTSAAR